MRAYDVIQLSTITSRSTRSILAALKAGAMHGAVEHPVHGWILPAENLDRVRFARGAGGLRFLRPEVVAGVLRGLPEEVAEPLRVEADRSGPATCLRCFQSFDSSDVRKNRICPACALEPEAGLDEHRVTLAPADYEEDHAA